MYSRLIALSGILLLCGSGFAQAAELATAPVLSFPTMLNIPMAPCLPFSAQVVSENTTHQGGKQVVMQALDTIMRDSAGRTRAEFQIPVAPGSRQRVENIIILDPTLQVLIQINPQTKTATVRRSNNIVAENTCVEKIAAPAVSAPPNPTPVSVTTFPDGSTQTTESLGTESLEGFAAVGVRNMVTNSTGLSAREDWYSPDLQMELLKTEIDSKSQRILRVQNVQSGEPDESNFQIPPDYTVHDERNQD